MKMLELIIDPNGSLSHTKLWLNMSNVVASIAYH